MVRRLALTTRVAVVARFVAAFVMVFAAGQEALCQAAAPPSAPRGAPPPSGAQGPFRAAIERDAETGWSIVVLRHEAPGAGDALEARIAPDAGGNLFGLKVGDDELLVQPAKLADLARYKAGTPILFPSPNRVRDARFTFEGETFTFEPNNEKNFIHGLVRSRPFSFDPPVAGRAGAEVRLHLDWNDAQPAFARFPIPHRLTVTYTLTKRGIRIAYEVKNGAARRLPFGFGLHPWFRIPGARGDVFLQVPAAQRMEAEAKLPTGKLLPVAGTPFDLRAPTALEGLDLDDVYFGLRPGRGATFELRDRKLRVTLAGSKEFTHLVVYTPPGKPFFCVENQTSSTDAHNLHDKGLARPAHLQIVEPGRSARGAVEWTISRLR
jgi:aldose 1-epimerase